MKIFEINKSAVFKEGGLGSQKVYKQKMLTFKRMSKGTLGRTINRKKKRKKDVVSEAIVKVLASAVQPMATQEIADAIGRPWHSVQTRCLQLQISGKLRGFRVGRINLWQEVKHE